MEQAVCRGCVCSCCGQTVDPQGHHYLICRGGELIARHDRICRRVSVCVRAVADGVQTEVCGVLSGKKRVDVLYQDLGGQVDLDVTVGMPTAAAYVGAAASSDLGCANIKERQKHRKYGAEAAAAGDRLLPFALEAFGAWGDEALGEFDRWARRVEAAEREGGPRCQGCL